MPIRKKNKEVKVKEPKPKKSRRLPLMNVFDSELRRLTKRANQRLVRLEEYQEEHGGIITPAYQQALFYLEGKKGKPRFKEWIFPLSQEKKDEQMFMVTAFLNNPLSIKDNVKKRDALMEKVIEAGEELEEPKGIFAKTGAQAPESETEEKNFWTLFDKAKEIGMMKTFDYQTVAKVISWKLAEKTDHVFRRIAMTMFDLQGRIEDLSRSELMAAIRNA